MTRYRMLVADELVPTLTELDNLPAHITVVGVGPSVNGRCLVTVEDTRAPSELDGHQLDPTFTRRTTGAITIHYGHPVDPCER